MILDIVKWQNDRKDLVRRWFDIWESEIEVERKQNLEKVSLAPNLLIHSLTITTRYIVQERAAIHRREHGRLVYASRIAR